MLAFGALLRASRLQVTTGSLADAMRALETIDLENRQDVYLALGAVLVSRREEQAIFDRCFEAFWAFPHALALNTEAMPSELAAADEDGEVNPESGSVPRTAAEAISEDGESGEIAGEEPFELSGGSDLEVLMEQDFSTFSAEQLDEVARVTRQVAKRLARRVSRRRKPSRRTGVVDLRRTMRASLMCSEIIELQHRARRRSKLRLVLLCDVSGSMEVYSRFLLQFLYSLQNGFGKVHTFTFATRLTCVSDLLRSPSYKTALVRLRDVTDWSGGTRIGDSLQAFNQDWGKLVDRRTIVLVLSDGWDAGEPDAVAQEMLTLKRRAGRIVWLNPLLGDPTYEPLTRGMAAALPLVDRFAAAHSLASLRHLAGHLTLR